MDQAEDLDPPGALSTPQRGAGADAGVPRERHDARSPQNLPTLLQAKDEDTKALGIAEAMKRFLASDVIYSDEFVGPAQEALEKDDITGIEVPDRPALPAQPGAGHLGGRRDPHPGAPAAHGPAQGGDDAAAGNLRGTSIVSTEALPSETRLTPGTPPGRPGLRPAQVARDGGERRRLQRDRHRRDGASFFYPSDPQQVDEKQAQIDELGARRRPRRSRSPGPTTPVFGEQGTLRIEVDAVTGETNTDNNAAEYPVKITI